MIKIIQKHIPGAQCLVDMDNREVHWIAPLPAPSAGQITAWWAEYDQLPTKADKLKAAATAYKEDMLSLQEQYLSSLFDDDATGAADIKAAAATRKSDYLTEITQIREA